MIISSAFGWFAGIRGINSFFWRLFAGLLAVIVLSSFLGFGVHTYLNRDEARYGKVDVFVGGRKAVQAALIIYQLKGQDALVEWLKSPGNVLPTVYIVDDHGSEISGRTAPELALRSIEENSIPEVEDHVLKNYPLNAVEDIEINGRPYTAFAVLSIQSRPAILQPLWHRNSYLCSLFGCPDSDGFCFCNSCLLLHPAAAETRWRNAGICGRQARYTRRKLQRTR